MVEFHYKNYLKKLALSVSAFWQGYEEQALEMVLQADLDLDSSVGKHVSQRLHESLEGYLKKWRDIILCYNSSPAIIMPSHPQDYIKELKIEEDSPINTSLSSSEIVREEPIKPKKRKRHEKPIEPVKIITAEEELNEALELYNNEKVLESMDLIQNLRKKHNRDFLEFPVIKEIENDFKDINEVFEALRDKEGWISESTGKIKISYKNVPGTPTYSLLSEAEMDVSIFNLLAVMYEADLYHTWVPFCKQSYVVANISRSRRIVAQHFSVPLITSRSTCVYGYGVNLLMSHGFVLIISKSCDENSTFKGVQLPESTTKRAVVNILGCVLRPITYEKISITMITNFDPKIKIVPYKVQNYFSRKLAKGMFKKIMNKARNFEGSEYQKRMSMPESRDFYDFLEKSQREFFDKMNNKQV